MGHNEIRPTAFRRHVCRCRSSHYQGKGKIHTAQVHNRAWEGDGVQRGQIL